MDTPLPTVDLKQLRALNNSLRLEIHNRLEDEGPASARELAERMGVDELRLYYHLKKLAEVGLIKTLSSRPTATKPEAIYAIANQIWVTGFDLSDPVVAEVVIRNAETFLKLAAKEYRAAIETYKTDPIHYSSYFRFFTRMSPKTRKEFNRRFNQLIQWVSAEEQEGDPRFTVTMAISPPVNRKP
jgi:DNA-binding transcriptional ArsR family regulator